MKIKVHIKLYKFINAILIIGIVIIIFLCSRMIENKIIEKIWLEKLVLILYFLIFIESLLVNGLLSLNTLFISTYGLFTFGGIFVKVFFGIQYESINNSLGINLDDNLIMETLYINTVFLIAYWLGSKLKINKEYSSIKVKENVNLYNAGKLLMFLSLPAQLIRYYFEISYVSNAGVLIYLLGSRSIPVPIVIRIFSIVFHAGFCLIYTSMPSKKMFIKFSLLYTLTLTPSFLLGMRSQFVLTVIFVLWLAKIRGDIFIKKSAIIIFAGILIIFMQILGTVRFGGTFESIPIGMIFLNFIKNQSMSFYVLPLYIKYKPNILYQSYPFILDSFISWLFPSGQSLAVLKSGRSSLGHQLMYTISPDYYLSGASLGTSMIAELYEFGYIGVFLGGLFYPVFINIFNKYCKEKRVILYFALVIVQAIVFAPRASYFPGIYNIIRYGIVYSFVILICNSILKKKSIISFIMSRDNWKEIETN